MASITGGHCLCPPERQGKAVKVSPVEVCSGNVCCDELRYGGHGSDGFDTLRHVGLRRSRLGSFRKDLIWRSWFRYGGLGEVWRGMISLDELEFGRAVMARYDLLS